MVFFNKRNTNGSLPTRTQQSVQREESQLWVPTLQGRSFWTKNSISNLVHETVNRNICKTMKQEHRLCSHNKGELVPMNREHQIPHFNMVGISHPNPQFCSWKKRHPSKGSCGLTLKGPVSCSGSAMKLPSRLGCSLPPQSPFVG